MDEIKMFIVLSLMFFGSSVRANDETACEKAFAPEFIEELCCETFNVMNIFDNEVKGCNTTDPESSEVGEKCAEFECPLRKQGLMEGDKIIEDKVQTYLDEVANKHPNQKHVLDGLKEKCLNGRYTKSPLGGDCMATKFYVCLYYTVMMNCETWKDTKVCKKLSGEFKRCKEEMKNDGSL